MNFELLAYQRHLLTKDCGIDVGMTTAITMAAHFLLHDVWRWTANSYQILGVFPGLK
jgi:hypothetical protein